MEVGVQNGCGLDIHKETVVAVVKTPAVGETRTYGTHTRQLRMTADWLASLGVTDIVMQLTGIGVRSPT